MVTAGTRLLRTLARAGKAQRRTVGKLVKVLFAKPKVKPAAKPKATLKPVAKSKATLKPVAQPKATPKLTALRPVRTKAPPPAPRARSQLALAALPGKWLAFHYSALPTAANLAGQRMSYWLYLPDKPPPAGRSLPLIVMLHGCEQSATEFAQGTRMNRLAEKKGYAVLYPQQLLSSNSHRCWKWYDKATQEGGGGVKMIVGIIEQVAAKYAIDRSRIYICGISAGAAMADIVALNHPQLIAAVGLHSGPVFGCGHSAIGALGVMQHGAGARAGGAITDILAKNPGFPPMPAMLIQGADDKVVRPVNQNQLLQQSLLLNRMPGNSVPLRSAKPAGKAARNPAKAYETRNFYVGKKLLLSVAHIEQLGHAWSGGDASLSYNSAAGPDSSKLMLDFFARHRRL